MSVEVRIQGLRELQRAFRKVDSAIAKEMRTEFKKVAEKVAQRTAAKVPIGETGKAAASVKPRSGGAIAAGGKKAEYYPWLDFGGRVGRNKSISRPVIPGGRYLYPTITESRDEIEEAASEIVLRLARSAGFNTHG